MKIRYAFIGIAIVGLLFGCNYGTDVVNEMGVVTTRAAKDRVDSVRFSGYVYTWDEISVLENDEIFFYMNIGGVVEVDDGETYSFTYSDKQPLASTPSGWKQFRIVPEYTVWTFGNESHFFEATGKINAAQVFVFPPGEPTPFGTPALSRNVGTFKITNGTWGALSITGGQVMFNYTMDLGLFLRGCGSPDNPCQIIGTVHGQFTVE